MTGYYASNELKNKPTSSNTWSARKTTLYPPNEPVPTHGSEPPSDGKGRPTFSLATNRRRMTLDPLTLSYAFVGALILAIVFLLVKKR